VQYTNAAGITVSEFKQLEGLLRASQHKGKGQDYSPRRRRKGSWTVTFWYQTGAVAA